MTSEVCPCGILTAFKMSFEFIYTATQDIGNFLKIYNIGNRWEKKKQMGKKETDGKRQRMSNDLVLSTWSLVLESLMLRGAG